MNSKIRMPPLFVGTLSGTTRFNPEVSCGNCKEFQKSFKICNRCALICYCSKECQVSDFPSHKKLCKGIGQILDEIGKVEDKLRHYPLDGQKVNCFDPDWHNGNFWTIHPSDESDETGIDTRYYIRMRRKLAELMWTVADKYQSYSAVWDTCRFLEETMNVEKFDLLQIRSMLAWMYLYLGDNQRAYNFMKHWIWSRYEIRAQFLRPVQQPDWNEDQDMKEDLFKILPPHVEISDTSFLLAIAAIKWQIIADMEWNKTNSRPDKRLKMSQFNQMSQITDYLLALKADNLTFLKMLLNPEPVVNLPWPSYIVAGGISEAVELTKITWRYIDKLNGFKSCIVDLIFPNIPRGVPNPSYCTTVETPPHELKSKYDKLYALSWISRKVKQSIGDEEEEEEELEMEQQRRINRN